MERTNQKASFWVEEEPKDGKDQSESSILGGGGAKDGKDQSESSIWGEGGVEDGKDQSETSIWGEGGAKDGTISVFVWEL